MLWLPIIKLTVIKIEVLFTHAITLSFECNWNNINSILLLLCQWVTFILFQSWRTLTYATFPCSQQDNIGLLHLSGVKKKVNQSSVVELEQVSGCALSNKIHTAVFIHWIAPQTYWVIALLTWLITLLCYKETDFPRFWPRRLVWPWFY